MMTHNERGNKRRSLGTNSTNDVLYMYGDRRASQVAELAFLQVIIMTTSPQQFPKALVRNKSSGPHIIANAWNVTFK